MTIAAREARARAPHFLAETLRLPRLVLQGAAVGAALYACDGPERAPRDGFVSTVRSDDSATRAAAVREAPTTSADASEPEPSSSRGTELACPAGMVQVEGDYCTALVHHCLTPRGLDGKPTDAPNYYFCDEFRQGYAACLGKVEHKRFCIDTYEYPNQKGAIPAVMVSWYAAQAACAARGARLCGDDEWTLACEGPERRPYAYGWKRDASACNIDKPWRKPDDCLLASKDPADAPMVAAELDRLSQREPSGARPACVSPYGVYDMGGNVDEWAENVTLGGKPYRSLFKGGHWVKGARNRCRPQTESHDETTAYYAEGFRCCLTNDAL